jgi:alpha-L-fucosidase 2
MKATNKISNMIVSHHTRLSQRVCSAAALFMLFFFVQTFCGFAQVKQVPMVLWYTSPATLPDSLPYLSGKSTNPFDDRLGKGWVEALPIGNGKAGAMIYGGIHRERMQLNEETLWNGFKSDENNRRAAAALPVVRKLLFEGNDDSATALANTAMIGIPKDVSAYQPMGDVWFEFDGLQAAPISGYRRELNIDNAVSTVRFKSADVEFTRESFASHPHNIIVSRFTASQKRRISVKISLHREKDASTVVDGKKLSLRGQIVALDSTRINRGMSFQTQVLPLAVGGTTSFENNHIVIRNADEVILLIAQATSFHGKDPGTVCSRALAAASALKYHDLKKRHVSDYQKLFTRVSFQVNDVDKNDVYTIPTNERIKSVAATGKADDYLSILQYQYSRYLMISSSRPGDLPANLQGLWNQHLKPAWESDYHTNINLQMNYWFVEASNLSECHLPLVDYIDTLVKKGSRTAGVHYNAKGWIVHHASDVFGYSAPVAGVWGVWPVGGAWLSRHSYEHFLFNRDFGFLRERAYPQLRGAAEFFLDFLVPVPSGLQFEGKLVTNPSHSPENAFERPDGVQSQFTYGATMDIEIIIDLFDNFLEALNFLRKDYPDLDKGLELRVRSARENLIPIQISKTGRIQEWIEDYKELEPGHRHISHLYSLYPDNFISKTRTPELAAAALRTLEVRLKGSKNPPVSKFGAFDSYVDGKFGTGWGRAWISLFYARLGMGNEAYSHHEYLQSKFVLPNLLGIAHGTYQIDNVFGNAAGISEMLIQSHDGFINILPALPSKWKSGAVSGLRTIGGFEVSEEWKELKLTRLSISSSVGGICRLKVPETVSKILSGSKRISFTTDANGLIAFETKPGKHYSIEIR